MDLIEIPDFSEILDVSYDYCVICGEPNHSNYSLCCYKCNRVMDNANNFISIRNTFGKNAKFTKEDLIEYGIAEGYANQLINSLVRDDMLKVKGRYITFNNMHIDEYLSKIDKYIAVCELITKFREDKITAGEIKETREYKQGSFKQIPFYQFFKLVNREVVKKFEKYLLVTEDIFKSMENSTITQKQLQRWYNINLNDYRKGNVNESFILLNELLMNDYIDLKRHGVLDKDIINQLNVRDEVYEFLCIINNDFEGEISQIKIDLISKGLSEGKTTEEIIEMAGVTPKEYDDILKVARFKNNELGQLHDKEMESRKENFVRYLKENNLKKSCELSKLSLNDFYNYYENANQSSEFFINTTQILMDKYLLERSMKKSRAEAVETVQIKDIYVEHWLTRSRYKDFNDANLKVTVDLILEAFKENKSMEEITKIAEVDKNTIKRFIKTGDRVEIYKPLHDYYESEILPDKLDKFLKDNEHKSMRQALENTDLTEDEINMYYELGKNGDEKYMNFYEILLEEKKNTYVSFMEKRKSHNIAMRESCLTPEEYEECRDDLDRLLREIKFTIVLENIANNKMSNVAARNAGCSVDDIYEWYFKGRDGEEEYKKFYELFDKAYVKPTAVPIQEKLDNENASLEIIMKSNKHLFTKKDLDIWIKNGILKVDVFNLEKDEEETEEDEDEKPNKNEVKEISLNKFKRTKQSRSSLGKVLDEEYDVEELKKLILKK